MQAISKAILRPCIFFSPFIFIFLCVCEKQKEKLAAFARMCVIIILILSTVRQSLWFSVTHLQIPW